MTELELLAPARNADIGIAAVDSGADAVYIAGPAFGARKDAGNEVEQLSRLAEYAHRFGARMFVTVNTIVFEDELQPLRSMLREIRDTGADALIVQDMAVARIAREEGLEMPLHASTQCAVRDSSKAAFLASAGFSRIILERQMSLEGIREIRRNVGCELEFFVHGALCVSYSGNCYLSEYLDSRSANRGCCMQACRSRYDLLDSEGRILLKNKSVLSLRDFNLVRRLGDLAQEGISSFKIEGRLKNESYVRNVVKAYSEALDHVVMSSPDKFARSSFGKVEGGFEPHLDKTFNRGYTELFIDGQRGKWSAMEAAKGMGEEIGVISRVASDDSRVEVSPSGNGISLHNGDGFSFVASNGEVVGFRGDVCEGYSIRCHGVRGMKSGMPLYRNLDSSFEKEIASKPGRRLMDVSLDVRIDRGGIEILATSEDGRKATEALSSGETARDTSRMLSMIEGQLSKVSGIYRFHVTGIKSGEEVPYFSAAGLNAMRRSIAEKLDASACRMKPMGQPAPSSVPCPVSVTYKDNVANTFSETFYRKHGAASIEKAYELEHRPDAELMRSKYCVRGELGMCQKKTGAHGSGPLYLLNNGRRLKLEFDCRNCEMTVRKD